MSINLEFIDLVLLFVKLKILINLFYRHFIEFRFLVYKILRKMLVVSSNRNERNRFKFTGGNKICQSARRPHPSQSSTDVKQGCVLAPIPFSLIFPAMLTEAFKASDADIAIRFRSDGSVFNLDRLQAKPKLTTDTISEFLFVDDRALNSSSEADMQCKVEKFADVCNLVCYLVQG